jgi:cytochrome c biogenesis protein CcdA
MITVQRRRIIDRQLRMLKRMILPTFSLIFLGIVYLTLFFQAIANQYQTHFLTYRLSYLFIAIGMSFIHIITILHTPPIKTAVLELFYCLRRETLNNVSETTNSIIQQQQRREDQAITLALLRYKFEPMEDVFMSP